MRHRTMKPEDRDPFDSGLKFLNVVPRGHEKALKHGLYNAVATLLLFIGVAAACGLFYILEPFVQPLVWALLVGSVLHPFKRRLERRFESWLEQVETSAQPLVVAVVMLPVRLVDGVCEAVGSALRQNAQWIVGGCIAVFIVFATYTYIPNAFLSTVYALWNFNCNMLFWLLHNITPTMFASLAVMYVGVLVFWTPQPSAPAYGNHWALASYVAWFLTALFLAHSIGYFTIPIFIFFNVCFGVGFVHEVSCIYQASEHKSYVIAMLAAVQGTPDATNAFQRHSNLRSDGETEGTCVEVEEKAPSNPGQEALRLKPATIPRLVKVTPDVPGQGTHSPAVRRQPSGEFVGDSHDALRRQLSGESASGRGFDDGASAPVEPSGWPVHESSRYIYGVIWACGLILLWRYLWLVHLLPIPIALYVIKRIGYYFGIWAIVELQWQRVTCAVEAWVHARDAILFPAPVQGLFKLGRTARGKLMEGVRGSISSFATTLVILGLILFVFCFFSYLVVKIYAEGIHLVAVGASVINSTVVHNPEFLQLLPEGWTDTMEAMLNNAYIYGREGISKQLRSLLRDVEPAKASELERHVLEFWDRVYQAWLMGAVESPAIGPNVPASAVATSWNNFVATVQKTPGVLNMGLVAEFLRDNLETLFSLLDSVWSLLKGNVGLVFHFLLASVSVLLGGGSAVLNFLLNGIVFFTALFYLLASSRDLYTPVELLSNFSPVNGNKVGVAFEAAITGVFKASFKMALFYGLWTWLIHNLFQVRIIYLPSVLAAVLGAVPFLGTYWASVPAVLELWLAQGHGVQALALLVCQCLPMSFVDTAIYMEIRGGGHPYMTGLAIAGGVFCMGIQGAIFGPLLLCCLLVALNMSSSLMKESPSEPNLPPIPLPGGIRARRRSDTVM